MAADRCVVCGKNILKAGEYGRHKCSRSVLYKRAAAERKREAEVEDNPDPDDEPDDPLTEGLRKLFGPNGEYH